MRKRNLWKAAGIMAAGVLTVSMAGGETARVYASETKIAASADRETGKEKDEKSKTVTPVLLLDKDGKPVIGPDGKPVYVTPTPAKEADAKPVPDASGAESKEDASGVLADEGQPGSEQEASGMSEGTAALPVGEVVAVPVPVPEETESAGALAEMEAGASSEEVPSLQEESSPEDSEDSVMEEPVDNGAAAENNMEEHADSSPAESAPEENTETQADAGSADRKSSDVAEIPGAPAVLNAENPSGHALQETISPEDAKNTGDSLKEDPSEALSGEVDTDIPKSADKAEGTDAGVPAAAASNTETAPDVSDGKLPADTGSTENTGTVTVTSVRDLFTTAVIPAATACTVEEEEESPSFFAALIGMSEDGAAQDAEKESAGEKEKGAESAPTASGDKNSSESASAASGDTGAAGKDSSGNKEEAVVYEIDAVTEELAGPGTNQLVGNTDSVGTKTVTANSTSASTGGYSGSSSYSSSSSGSGSSGSASGTSYQNSSPGASAIRTANPKTGDTSKARVYFGTAFASLAAIFKVMLETERAKKKIRR